MSPAEVNYAASIITLANHLNRSHVPAQFVKQFATTEPGGRKKLLNLMVSLQLIKVYDWYEQDKPKTIGWLI